MSLGEIKAGRAFVEIIAKDKTKAGIGAATGSLKGMASGLLSAATMVSTAVAAISSSAIIGAAKHFADVGSELSDMSARTGVAAEQLQFLGFAARQSGATLADVEAALRNMAKKGLNPADFEALGKKIAAIEDPGRRAAESIENFGKSGTRLIPMFKDFAALKSASDALGPILTSEEVARADSLGDAMSALSEAASRAAQQVGSKLAPALQDALEIATGLTVEFSKWASGTGEAGGLVDTLEQALEGGAGGLLGKLYSDRIAEMLRGAERTGEAGGAGGDAAKAAAEQAFADAKMQEEIDKIQQEMMDSQIEIYKRNVDKAKAAIQEFETPAEKFQRRMIELSKAMSQANTASQLGVISALQRNQLQLGLQGAMGRLRQQEQERLAKEMKKVQAKTPKAADSLISGGARGTFSARGAGQLGFGTRVLTEDKNGAAIVKNLVAIKEEVGKIVPVFK